jgi:hypothetical protein
MVIDFLEELRRAKHPEKEKKKEAKPWHKMNSNKTPSFDITTN